MKERSLEGRRKKRKKEIEYSREGNKKCERKKNRASEGRERNRGKEERDRDRRK